MGRPPRKSGYRSGQLPLRKVAPRPPSWPEPSATAPPTISSPHQPPFPAPQHPRPWPASPEPVAVPNPDNGGQHHAAVTLSPQSNRTLWSPSAVVDSTPTSYTAGLDQARNFSPDVPTPSSSNISCTTNHVEQAAPQLPLWQPQYHAAEDHSGQDPADPMRYDVVGLEARATLQDTDTSYLRQSPQFISRGNLSPANRQRYPEHWGPWSPFPFRHEDPFLNHEYSSSEAGDMDVSQETETMTTTTVHKQAVRGKLREPARQNAYRVRQVGACLRCKLYKELCDDLNVTCHTCSIKVRRTFPRYCIRPQFDWDSCKPVLLPDELFGRLAWSSLNHFVNSSTFQLANRRPFFIPLDLHAGIRLRFSVYEYDPLELSPGMPGIRHAYDPNDGPYAKCEVWNPPIIMQFRGAADLENQAAYVTSNVDKGFYYTLNDRCRWEAWTTEYFTQEADDFQTEILQVLGAYYRHDVDEHAVLRSALSLLWYELFLLNKPTIPASGRAVLAQHLTVEPSRQAWRCTHVAPEILSRFCKAVVFRRVEHGARRVIQALHGMLFRMAVDQDLTLAKTDLALCLCFVVLIFMGRMQWYLVLLSRETPAEIELDYSLADAEARIREMEAAVGEYLTSFHKYTLSRKPPTSSSASPPDPDSACDAHAHHFNLVGRLRALEHKYADDRPSDFGVSPLDSRTFSSRNIGRLCWKLLQSVPDDATETNPDVAMHD